MLRDEIDTLKQKLKYIREGLEKLDDEKANPLVTTMLQDQMNLKLFVEDLNRARYNFEETGDNSKYLPSSLPELRLHPFNIRNGIHNYIPLHSYECMIHPLSLFSQVWNTVYILFHMIYIFLLPLGIGFAEYNSMLPGISLFLTIFVIIDSWIKLNTGIVIESTIDMEPKQVRNYYWKRKCIVFSCLACFPFIFILAPNGSSDRIYNWILLINLIPTIVLIQDKTRTVLAIEYIQQYRQSSLSLAVINGAVLLVVVFYYVHLYICVNNFINQYTANIDRPFHILLFEGISFIFGGEWGVKPQGHGYQYTVHIIVASIISSLFMANITIYLLSLNTPSREFLEKLEEVDQFVLAKGVGKEIHERMVSYYHFKYADSKYFDEQKILRELNTPLKLSILLRNYQNFLFKVPFLKNASFEVMAKVVSSLQVEHFLKEDIVIEEGSTGDQMYFIAKGKMNVYIKGVKVSSLKSGDYFGGKNRVMIEISLLFGDVKRTATVEAATNCIIYSLNRTEFRKIIELDATVSGMVSKLALKRMAQNKIDILPYTPLKRMVLDKSFHDNESPRDRSTNQKSKKTRVSAVHRLLKPSIFSSNRNNSSSEHVSNFSNMSDIDDIKSSIHASSSNYQAAHFINGSFMGSKSSNMLATSSGELPSNEQIISQNLQDISLDIKCNDKILNVRDETVAKTYIKSKMNIAVFPEPSTGSVPEQIVDNVSPSQGKQNADTFQPVPAILSRAQASSSAFNSSTDKNQLPEVLVDSNLKNSMPVIPEISIATSIITSEHQTILPSPPLEPWKISSKAQNRSLDNLTNSTVDDQARKVMIKTRKAAKTISGNRDFIQLDIPNQLIKKNSASAMNELENELKLLEKSVDLIKDDIKRASLVQRPTEVKPNTSSEKPQFLSQKGELKDAISDAQFYFNQSKAIHQLSEFDDTPDKIFLPHSGTEPKPIITVSYNDDDAPVKGDSAAVAIDMKKVVSRKISKRKPKTKIGEFLFIFTPLNQFLAILNLILLPIVISRRFADETLFVYCHFLFVQTLVYAFSTYKPFFKARKNIAKSHIYLQIAFLLFCGFPWIYIDDLMCYIQLIPNLLIISEIELGALINRVKRAGYSFNMEVIFGIQVNIIASISVYANFGHISDYTYLYSQTFHEAAARMLNNGCGALYPATPEEYYLRSVNILLNAIFLAFYVGNISRYMIGLDSTGRKFHEQLEQVGQFINYKGLGRELKNKILHFYSLKYTNNKYFDEERIFQELNQPLKLSIYLRECAPLIRQVPFFKSSEKGFISNLVMMLKPVHFLKDDIVIEKGSVGTQMFFISSGYLEVNLNGRVLGKLSPGQYFGEIALLLKNPKRTATIKALSDCFLFSLSREALYKIKDWYPDVGKKMQEIADERIAADKMNFMTEVPFFKGASKEFFSEVFTALRMVTFDAGDLIIEKGTIGEEMYFIIGGSVNVVINDVVTFTMSAGMYFGGKAFLIIEIAILLENTKRTVNIVAATFCTLYSLSKYDLNTITLGHPELADKILQVANERIFNDKIRNIVTKVPFLKTASNDVVAKLAKLIQIRNFQAGHQIYDIGMTGDSMFFIISGEIGIYDEERKISQLSDGQFFGEISLLFKDSKRTGRVIAVSNCELYELHRANLNKVTADDPKLGEIIEAVANSRIMENKVRKLVSEVPVFHGASKNALSKIAKLLKLERFYHGTMIVKKDEVGNGMYFIAYGTLDVIKDGKVVAVLESGQYFGEIDLLTDCVRTASVIASGTCELYYLSKDNFKEVVAEFPQIKEVLEEVAKERIQNDKIRKVLNEVPFFSEVEDSIISYIFEALTLVHFFPNSVVFEKDEIGSCMYFVASGKLVAKVGKETITYMGGGQFFGETECTLYTLQRADLEQILFDFPIAAAKLKKVAEERLRYDKIREMIKKVSFFKDIEEEAIMDITKILKTEYFSEGSYVIVKDQLADKMYFVTLGKFQVIINDMVVSELSNSQFFGEIAILQADTRRTASVKSAGNGELLSLSRVELQGVLKKYPKILESLKKTVEKRLARDGLRARILEIPIFKEANASFVLELIDNLSTEIHFSEDKIITQGDLADAMYFITFGEVNIYIDDQMIGTMSSGQYFGGIVFANLEIALLTENTLRTASIVAVGTCEFLKLNKFSFNSIVERYPDEKLRLQLEAEKLILNDKVRIIQISKQSPLFKCKNIEVLEAAADLLTLQKLTANKVIFEKNAYGDCIYFVKSGKVTIKDAANFMYDLKKGDCFGGKPFLTRL
ncbi:Potassium voltage-gated channel sub H member 7 [Boothiomyces sp. JEL0866]|nr:Potassium voltage-gated channel sub H member 7 [Boothiomyces sp. JEL0866]